MLKALQFDGAAPQRRSEEYNDVSDDHSDRSTCSVNSRLDRMLDKYFPDTDNGRESAGQSTQERPLSIPRETPHAINLEKQGPPGMGFLMEALRQDAMRKADDFSDSCSSDNSIDSDDELEQWAQQIRGEIRDSEMVELALEAERAADAGQEHFAGHPSTFGDDDDEASLASVKKPKPVQRRRSYTDAPISRRRIMIRAMSEKKKKLRVLALRNIVEVIPNMQELHFHLGSQMIHNGVKNLKQSNTEKVLGADDTIVAKGKTSPRINFLQNITSWVSSTNSRDDTATVSLPMKSLLDRDDDDNSVTSQTDYEVGDILAEHFYKSDSGAGVPVRHIRVPSGLVLPDFDDFHDLGFGNEKADDGTLGTAPTSSSSEVGRHTYEPAHHVTTPRARDNDAGGCMSSPIPFTFNLSTPITLFNVHDVSSSASSFRANDDTTVLQQPHLFTTPVRQRRVRKAFGGLQMSNLGHWNGSKDDLNRQLSPRHHTREESIGDGTLQEMMNSDPLVSKSDSCLLHSFHIEDSLNIMPSPKSKCVGDLLNNSIETNEKVLWNGLHILQEPEPIECDHVGDLLNNSIETNERGLWNGLRISQEPEPIDGNHVGDLLNNSIETNEKVLWNGLHFSPEPEPIDGDHDSREKLLTPHSVVPTHAICDAGSLLPPALPDLMSERVPLILHEIGSTKVLLDMRIVTGDTREGHDVAAHRDSPGGMEETARTLFELDTASQTDILEEQDITEGVLAEQFALRAIVECAVESNSVHTPVFPCGCGMVLSRANSLDSVPGTVLHVNAGIGDLFPEGYRSTLRKGTSCPSLADRYVEEMKRFDSPNSVKGTLDTPARAGFLRQHTHTCNELAMDVLMRLSPKTKAMYQGSPVNDMTARTENDAYLSNYLYCIRDNKHMHAPIGDQRFCGEPCGATRSVEHCGFLGSSCNSFSGVIDAANFIFPTKAPPRDPLNLNPGSYHGRLKSETWFDAASERFDGAIERFVGPSRTQNETWNTFQAPSLKAKSSDLIRATPSNLEARVGQVILVDDAVSSPSTDFLKYVDDVKWHAVMYEVSEFKSIPEREIFQDETLKNQESWVLKSSSGETSIERFSTRK